MDVGEGGRGVRVAVNGIEIGVGGDAVRPSSGAKVGACANVTSGAEGADAGAVGGGRGDWPRATGAMLGIDSRRSAFTRRRRSFSKAARVSPSMGADA